LSGATLVTVKIDNQYILRKIAFIRVIGLFRENRSIKYAALVLAIVFVGSVLVSGLAMAKTPVSGSTDKVLFKVKNPHTVAKTPNAATKAMTVKPTAKTKAVVKPTVKPTVKKMVVVKPTVKPTAVKSKP